MDEIDATNLPKILSAVNTWKRGKVARAYMHVTTLLMRDTFDTLLPYPFHQLTNQQPTQRHHDPPTLSIRISALSPHG